MTKEERAENFANGLCPDMDVLTGRDCLSNGYIQGATEQDPISRADQQRIDIGKACSNHTIEQLAKCALDPTMSCNQKAMLMKEIIKQAIEG